MMRCYYEVLSVEETATNDELKKAYRKLALKCHPDKNLGREQEANEEFKEVCSAYSTLSDPQLRAFYDRNKENILRATDGKASKQSHTPDVFAYFSSSCYPGGFSDSPDGFYATYSTFFDDLSVKDMKYMKEEDPEVPPFGSSTADLEDVATFYGYWSSYCTSMPFAWADQVDVRDASCRWVEKKIERENRKYREQARKTFNEEVRNLVLVMRKRDPRMKERSRILEERAAAAAARREQHHQHVQQERHMQLQQDMQDEGLVKAKQEYMQQLKAMEREMRGGDDLYLDSDEDPNGGEDEDEDEEDFDELICLFCVKAFTSERTMEVHMKTKKHKLKIAQILKESEQTPDEDEEEEEGVDSVEKDEPLKADAVSSEAESEQQYPSTRQNKKNKKKRKQDKKMNKLRQMQELDQHNSSEEKDAGTAATDNHVKEISSRLNDLEVNDNQKSTSENTEINNDISEISSSVPNISEPVLLKPESDSDVEVASKVGTNTKNKHELKGTKSKDTKIKGKISKESNQSLPDSRNEFERNEILCLVCEVPFTSKNKLFKHIEKTGHAALKESKQTKKKGKKKPN